MADSTVLAFILGVLATSLAFVTVLSMLAMNLWRFATRPIEPKRLIETRSKSPSEPPPSKAVLVDLVKQLYVTAVYQQDSSDFSVVGLLRSDDKQKSFVWGRLANSTLTLSPFESSTESLAVIDLSGANVSHFPADFVESERWLPEYPIKVQHAERKLAYESKVLYLFSPTGVDKEDWFLKLSSAAALFNPKYVHRLQAEQELSRVYTNHLLHGIKSPNMGDDTRWFNAFLGRLFSDVNRRDGLTHYFTNKINQKIRRKLSRDGKPSFLGDVKVRKLIVGHSLPILSEAKLKHLSSDGALTVEAYLCYHGGFSITVETTVLVPGINIRVSLVLTVRVLHAQGRVRLFIRAPPTECIWLGFHGMPDMQLVIDPVVADKTITWPSVVGLIDKSIREAVVDAMVLPNMDDYPMPSVQGGSMDGEVGMDISDEAASSLFSEANEDDFVMLSDKGVFEDVLAGGRPRTKTA